MGMSSLQMEWRISNDGHSITTVESCYWTTDYKKNGQLKKNARKSPSILFWTPYPDRTFFKHIVLEHNLWINRDNAEKQLRLLYNAARDAIQYMFSVVHDKSLSDIKMQELLDSLLPKAKGEQDHGNNSNRKT